MKLHPSSRTSLELRILNIITENTLYPGLAKFALCPSTDGLAAYSIQCLQNQVEEGDLKWT